MPATPPERGPRPSQAPRDDLDLEDGEDALLDDRDDEHDVIEEFEHSQRREAGLNEDAPPGHGPDKDDADLEDLILEDGARSPFEEGSDLPADHELNVIDEDDFGLEEDERAPRRPTPGESR
ncbi:serine kinase/phosphatase [Pseudomonas benzenivorans]|uniref:Serine kinase/phosphatase n=1 Tax=Pseudomonas benzenivorans TaxID=556533 RepID=A0ABY5HB33_9PSED|nr:serine kinase/phosphatase [Pseudomonas benzenivorans]UTW09194.1 serine kinase/phosphatase [Pseudomonas benzenivorans]